MTTKKQQEYALGLKNQDDRRLIESKQTLYNYYHSSPTKAKEIPDIEELGLSEEEVEDFGKEFLKNVNELAEIDE